MNKRTPFQPFQRQPLIDLDQIEKGKEILERLEDLEGVLGNNSEISGKGKEIVTSSDITVVNEGKNKVSLKINGEVIRDIYNFVSDTLLDLERFVYYDDNASINLLSIEETELNLESILARLGSIEKQIEDLKVSISYEEIKNSIKALRDEIEVLEALENNLYKISLSFLATIENYELNCEIIGTLLKDDPQRKYCILSEVPENILRVYLYAESLGMITEADIPEHVKKAKDRYKLKTDTELDRFEEMTGNRLESESVVTQGQLEEALMQKADKQHKHDEYLTEHQKISHLATSKELEQGLNAKADKQHIHKYEEIENVPSIPSISHLATREELVEGLELKANVKHIHTEYLTSHQDISHLVTRIELPEIESIATKEYIEEQIDAIEIPSIEGLASEEYVNEKIEAIEFPVTDISHLATKEELSTHTHSHNDLTDNPEIPSIEGLATVEYVEQKFEEYKCPCIDEDDEEQPSEILVLEYTVTDNNRKELLRKYLPEGIDYISIEIEGNDGQLYTDPMNVSLMNTKSVKLYYRPVASGIRFENTYIENLIKFDPYYLTDVVGMFENCIYLESLDLSSWDTREITDMYFMFNGCASLKNLNLSGWNIQRVSDLRYMFAGCSSLEELNISDWDVSLVTTMAHMFSGCSKLSELNISRWDVTNLEDISYMFYECSSLVNLDLVGWNVVSLENMEYAFSHCHSLQNLDMSRWESNNIKTMKSAFEECYSLPYLNISSLDVRNVIDMSGMFYECSSLTLLNISKWNTQNVLDLGSMFYGCSSLGKLDLAGWDTDRVRDLSYMFAKCSNLRNLNLSGWDTSDVSNKSGMFIDTRIDEWNYDGSNYSKWNLTENETGYKNAFPWNA